MTGRDRDHGAVTRHGLLTWPVLAGLLVAVAGLVAPTASAAPLLHPQTRVAAIAEPTGQLVGPHASVLPGESRQRAPSYDQPATGSSVAAEGAESSDTIHSVVAAADEDIDPQEVMRNAQNVYYDENGDQVYVWDHGDGSAEITIRNPGNGNIVTNQTSTSEWVDKQVQSGRWWSLNG